jgi:hypothetical protein
LIIAVVSAGVFLFAVSILYVIPMIPVLALVGIALAPTSGAMMAYGLWWGKSPSKRLSTKE